MISDTMKIIDKLKKIFGIVSDEEASKENTELAKKEIKADAEARTEEKNEVNKYNLSD